GAPRSPGRGGQAPSGPGNVATARGLSAVDYTLRDDAAMPEARVASAAGPQPAALASAEARR
ncbi:MAG TPA: hypothetical protein VEP68_02590, partial [Anaeromyxobacteraceae bacterium]|nr:hypothetical protein [Anaeromyxobacteraceae bacterium]